ncbi:sulfurtransferase [Tuwongella immobilis]|uniref:Rhodanese domain-containing protein n=1 Tax=Tuwongella immobilis TaxID=692036 RepID=A0A6C2YNA6_9BACT
MLALVMSTLLLSEPANYAKPRLLIEAKEIAEVSPILLDVRPEAEYAKGHIPGAIPVNAKAWGDRFYEKADVAEWTDLLGGVGISGERPIVVYGENLTDVARIWWIIRYWGISDVRILNGGWSAWKISGGEISTTPATKPARVVPKLTAQADRFAQKDDLMKSLMGDPAKGLQIVDARSMKEHCGETNTAKRNGAMPGAKSLEWVEVLDPKTKRFKPADELQLLLKERGIDLNRPSVTHCQGGGRAAVVAFTLELMGGKQVSNYYRSWSEWGNEPDTLIVKPMPPKK